MRVVILLLAILALSAFIGCQAKPMVGSESGSGSEGIKVHGDWTVEVTNPDGSLATRKQFANSFEGKHYVAAFLSHDLETARGMQWGIMEDTSGGGFSKTAGCKESSDIQNSNENILAGFAKSSNKNVLATAVHTPNANGEMDNSVWNSSCTLEIDGDESKFITKVWTILYTIPKIPQDINGSTYPTLSDKVLDEPIEVWDGQVVAATVIFSVD